MTATFEASRAGRGTTFHLSVEEVEHLRALLFAEQEALACQLTEHARVLVELGEQGADVEGVERELVGLHAARAREMIEEIGLALSRLADGTYGTCECCGRSIPFERLEAIPRARLCVACPPASVLQR